MKALARRDHSEKELRQKMSERFTPARIEEALEEARLSRWLAEPQDLAERTAEGLRRRGKGRRYVDNYLKEKGLPPTTFDADRELEKALELVENKLPSEARGEKIERGQREKLGRFLLARGFDPAIVRKVIYEKL